MIQGYTFGGTHILVAFEETNCESFHFREAPLMGIPQDRLPFLDCNMTVVPVFPGNTEWVISIRVVRAQVNRHLLVVEYLQEQFEVFGLLVLKFNRISSGALQ